MAKYFLGVDGGQSSTTALVGDETGRVIAHARGGPCNHVSASEAREKFLRVIGGVVGEALDSAGLPQDLLFEAACLGFSGGAADKELLIGQLIQVRRKLVTNDALIALTGAHAGGPGIITIAGTGSICYGRNAAGKIGRVGGWGFVFGDEGGGFDLTRQALRAALRFEEGWGPETSLHRLLLEATGAKNANDLLHKFYTPEFPRPRVAGFSKLVEQAALEGDVVAGALLDTSAQQLAAITSAAVRMLFPASAEPAAVAPVGGVFRSARIRGRFQELVELGGAARVVEPSHGPAAGALLEAYRLSGKMPSLRGTPEEKATS
jgi:N-acetylglucosamine kinase-like BadF-type ATPase